MKEGGCEANIGVLHVIPDLRQRAGGIAATVPALAAALAGLGIESRYVTMAHDDLHEGKWITRAIGAYAHIPTRLRTAVAQALAGFAAWQSVVVHSHGLWHPLNHAAVSLASSLGLPSIVSVHGMLLPWARQHRKLRKDIAWLLFQRRDLEGADIVHVTSDAEAEIVMSIVGHDRVRRVPFGVDLPNAPVAMELSGPTRTLLFLGRLHRVKNLETLIRVFVRAAPPHWQLKLVGPEEDGHRAVLEAVTDALGAGNRIAFGGPTFGADKDREIAAAHALVLPSFSENFGAVVAEALALGRPVIASTGTPWQALVAQGCGWWVDPDPESLAGAIAALTATLDAELVAMGARGRAWARAALSWERAGVEMAGMYHEAAGIRALGR